MYDMADMPVAHYGCTDEESFATAKCATLFCTAHANA